MEYLIDPAISSRPYRFQSGDRIYLGKSPGNREFGLPANDLLGHMLIVGKSGTGKSNLLSVLCSRLLQQEGNIVLIDPHGNLSETVIGINRTKNLVYISSRVVESDNGPVMVQVNPLRVGRNSVERTSGWMREILASDTSISQGTWGPRLEVIFRALLPHYLSTVQEPSLPDFLDTLVDRVKMKKFTSTTSGSIRSMLSVLTGDWRKWNDYVASSLNKVIPLLANESVSNLLARGGNSLDLDSALSSGNSLFVVDVSKGNVSEESVRILSLLVLLVLWNRISSSSVSRKARTYFVVDEAKNTPEGIMNTLLSEGRKFGVSITLATQSLSQMDASIVGSILGNVRNFASFTSSASDAETLARMIPDRKIAERLETTIKSQWYHRCVLWNQSSEGFSGPATFLPELLEYDQGKDIVEERIADSIRKNGGLLPDSPSQQAPAPHTELVEKFTAKLERLGFRIRLLETVEGCLPDIVAEFGSTIILGEVELSDMANTNQIIRKLNCYENRRVVFITEEGNGTKLYNYLLNFTKCDFSTGIPAERAVNINGRRISASDLGDFLLRTTVVERRSGKFYSIRGDRLSLLVTHDMIEDSSFRHLLSATKNPSARIMLYKKMTAGKSSYLSVGEATNICDSAGEPAEWLTGLSDNGFVDVFSLFCR